VEKPVAPGSVLSGNQHWRRHYNTERPHRSLGYKPPAPEVFIPAFAARAALQPRPATPPALAERRTIN
jgi:putative transposase